MLTACAAAIMGVSAGPIGFFPVAAASAQAVSGPRGPENVPLEQGTPLAPASTAATGQMVDGVQCNSSEQVAYHVHTHLSVYVDGHLRPIPAGIGIVSPIALSTPNGRFDQASQCYYWLHVHAQDGVIHIESPAGHSYTLGDFFDLWRQPLNVSQVGPASGAVRVYVDGRPYSGDPRAVQLGSHVDIQIDVGTPVVDPRTVNWSVTSL
ncbi:MAG: hypothetical protein WBW80_07265 [Acidimicrobiales bacterium]